MSTYTPIASQTLSSAAASVTFSGIPQTYTDLVVVASVNESNDVAVKLNFNSDTGSNYSFTSLYGTGSTAGSDRASSQTYTDLGRYYDATSTTRPIIILNVMNYTNSTTNKTFLIRGTTPGLATQARVGLWRSTSAITSLDLAPTSGTFSSGATFNLYGIDASLSAQAKATGGTTIIRDSSYWYHVFTGSGTFTPTQAITADVMVLGGGGGGSATNGAGGGAGGLFYATSQSLTTTGYTVTVGAGGTGGTAASDSFGTSGNDSVFGSLTAGKGGGYGAKNGQGATGGCGGGSYNAAGGTSNQGSTGGTGYGNAGGTSSSNPASGGGGTGAAGGANGSPNTGGNGGNGTSAFSSWGSATSTGQLSSGTYYYGGGGGSGADARSGSPVAGTGGLGGGGAGTVNGSNAAAGTANTGGGGGSPGYNGGTFSGGAGGSGIVIIRYAV